MHPLASFSMPLGLRMGLKSALVGNQLLRLSMHPLDAFWIPNLLDLFLAEFGSEAFRAAVGLFLGFWSPSVACSKCQI